MSTPERNEPAEFAANRRWPNSPLNRLMFNTGKPCYPLSEPVQEAESNLSSVTCVDNGMPEVVLRAADVGVTGYETPAELEANAALRTRLERIRLTAGPLMNLGDVANKTVPKMCLIVPPRQGGMVSTRTFIPHTVHEAIGVLGAVSTATACLLPGSVAEEVAVLPLTPDQGYSVEHPTGEFTVQLEQRIQDGKLQIGKSGVVRTARLLSRGEVMVPHQMAEKYSQELQNTANSKR